LDHGLLTKTVIHPAQIAVVHAALAVSSSEVAQARAILAGGSPAVFASGGTMCEPATHRGWARTLIRRAELFGIADPLPLAREA
jgi:citrate lyase beta subunit